MKGNKINKKNYGIFNSYNNSSDINRGRSFVLCARAEDRGGRQLGAVVRKHVYEPLLLVIVLHV